MKLNYFSGLMSAFIFLGCQNTTKEKKSVEEVKKSEEVVSEWVKLSPSENLEGWHIFQNEDGTKTGWTNEDGVLTFDSENATGEGNKSLISDETYSSFEIQFEWKISPKSNSGFMWGVSEDKKYDHPYLTGPEIQIIDAEIYKGDEKNQIHTTGALYDMIAPDHLMAKPAGEWNQYHITINYKTNKGIVIHNGMEINHFPVQGPEWDSMVKNSKFKDMEGFGKHQEGHLSLQDHPGVISYKNIKIKRL